MAEGLQWVLACATDDIAEEDVLRFDHGACSYAIYRVSGRFYASDGWCTHEKAHLADGFVLGDQIECPRHQGRFHVPSGKALCAPVCIQLKTHPVRVEADDVLIGLPAAD
jgi:3-phenylpropionate/trans-cinnamate dioxygenase ferredoxin component